MQTNKLKRFNKMSEKNKLHLYRLKPWSDRYWNILQFPTPWR